jgi:hypothetical protein
LLTCAFSAAAAVAPWLTGLAVAAASAAAADSLAVMPAAVQHSMASLYVLLTCQRALKLPPLTVLLLSSFVLSLVATLLSNAVGAAWFMLKLPLLMLLLMAQGV